ncbi:MAG TPA: YadA-like family protein [Hyphomonadaceae bacterium]|nr:YadA-like family protein [Hyphomonadaceae bacterium]
MLNRTLLFACLAFASASFTSASCAQDAPPTNLGPGGLSCPSSTSCSEPTGIGNTIVGDFGYYASDTIVDLNTEPGFALGQTDIIGTQNFITAKNSRNVIVGHGNTAYGLLGNLGIYGDANTVTTDDANVSIVGNGNNVSGSQGENLGLTITGSGNTVNASSGTVAGVGNSIDNMTRGTVDGYFNSVTNSSDSQVVGNGNTVSGDQNITVGNGNTNQANGGVVVGSHSGLGADATNSVVLGNDTYTDRSDTVDVGGRSISNVAPGTYGTDAVNLDQMQGGDLRTLFQANAYTDLRFNQLGRRINRSGAAAGALGIVAANAAAIPGDSKFSAGFANYNGESAASVAYQRIFGHRKNVALTVGASFASGERMVGAAIGFGW